MSSIKRALCCRKVTVKYHCALPWVSLCSVHLMCPWWGIGLTIGFNVAPAKKVTCENFASLWSSLMLTCKKTKFKQIHLKSFVLVVFSEERYKVLVISGYVEEIFLCKVYNYEVYWVSVWQRYLFTLQPSIPPSPHTVRRSISNHMAGPLGNLPYHTVSYHTLPYHMFYWHTGSGLITA